MRLSPSIPTRTAAIALVASSLATLATLTAVTLAGIVVIHRDDCALPAGTSALDPSAQAAIATHAMACHDLQHDRITLAEYRLLIGVDTPPRPPAPPPPQWASSVRALSSEYSSSSWSAQQVLGAPDVYPRSGDDAHAWASRDADAPVEFIEVGFATPQRARQLQIFETLNPGAIDRVELISASGKHIAIQRDATQPTGGAAIGTYDLGCTVEPIVAARITLASAKVPGWNEIDAVGLLPCP
jgi:hypothetical protein